MVLSTTTMSLLRHTSDGGDNKNIRRRWLINYNNNNNKYSKNKTSSTTTFVVSMTLLLLLLSTSTTHGLSLRQSPAAVSLRSTTTSPMMMKTTMMLPASSSFSFPHHHPHHPQQQLLQSTRSVWCRSTTTTTSPTSLWTVTASSSSLDSSDDAASAPSSSSSSTGGTATISSLVANLVKSIVGAGILTLPSGIAAYGNAPTAVLPAIVLIGVFGVLSGYGFGLIGRTCALTQTSSYKTAWEESISSSTSWIPAVSVTLKTIMATLAYSMILGDTFTALVQSSSMVPPMIATASKTTILCTVTTFLLLPLCLLKNLSSLAPFSLLGSLGMVYTAIAMAIRYLTGAYVTTTRSSLALDLPTTLQPLFGTKGAASVVSPVTTILLGMLSTAYMAHFNAPKFYRELRNNTVPRYMTVVSTAFAISMTLFATVASLGFLTFGANCAGLILNNYSTRDTLMSLSRIAVAVSLVFSYPLAFVGARDGILDLFSITTRSPKLLNTLTVGLLSAITIAALIIPDVSFVLAFAGATLGNALIYIFPGLMFRGAIRRKVPNPTRQQKVEVKIALSSAVLGTGLGVLGAWKAIQSIL